MAIWRFQMTNRARDFAINAVSVIICVLAMTLAAKAQELTIRITYDEERDRTSPYPKLIIAHKAVSLLFNRNGTIKVINEDTVETTQRNEKQLELGPSTNSDRWRVVDKNKLIDITDFISFRRAILVTIAGNRCTAQVQYKLKPGFFDYQYTRYLPGGLIAGQVVAVGEGVARSFVARNMTCAISQSGDAR